MPGRSSRRTSARFMTRSGKTMNRTSHSHPKRARRSSVRWIDFRRHPGQRERKARVNPKSPARAGGARLGPSRAGWRRGKRKMVRFRQQEPDGERMQVGKIRLPRRVAPNPPLVPCCRSTTGEIETPRLPRGRRRNGARQPPIAIPPERHPGKLSRKVRPGWARRSRLKAPVRYRPPVRGPRHRARRAIRRRPERKAPLPTLAPTTRATPTSQQST